MAILIGKAYHPGMAKYNGSTKIKRQRERMELPSGMEIEFDVKLLSSFEQLQASAMALALYKSLAQPEKHSPSLAICEQACLVFLGTLDIENDEPFFESPDQILRSQDLTLEVLEAFSQRLNAFASEHDPRKVFLTSEEVIEAAKELGKMSRREAAFFLAGLQPKTQSSLVHSMAALLANFLI